MKNRDPFYLNATKLLILLILAIFLFQPQKAYANNPVENWHSTSDLPYLISSHAVFSSGDNVSVIGGSSSTGQSKKDVKSALVLSGGNLENWVTSSLFPEELIFHSVVRIDKYAFVMGGREENPGSELNHVGKVFSGEIDESGIVMAWNQINSIPERRSLGQGVVVGNRIYYAGGFNNSGVHDDIYYAAINPDGTLEDWEESDVALPDNLRGFGMVAYQDNIIIFGGRNNSDITSNKAYCAKVNLDGSIGNFIETSALPEAIYRGAFTIIGNVIISAGGHNGDDYVEKVYYSTVGNDGALSNWQTSAQDVPYIFTGASMTALNGYLYLMGGFDGNYLDNVYYSKLNIDEGINLSVPLFKQNDLAWGGQIYDAANRWSPFSPNISSWGCALTSAAMVFNYHGIEKLPSGVALNPGTLNAWLNSQSDGYVGNGLVNWLALSRLSRLAKSQNPNFSFSALEYSRINNFNNDQLITDLENGNPGILEVPGHFIVGKGISDSTVLINDPYFDRNNLSDYGNTFLSLSRYTPSNTDLSYIMIVTQKDLDIKVRDGSLNVVGESYIQQPLENDENAGQKSGDAIKTFYLSKPDNGNYRLSINSSTAKKYNFEIYYYDAEGNVGKENVIGVVGPNNPDEFILGYDKNKLNKNKSSLDASFAGLIKDIRMLASLNEFKSKFDEVLLKKAENAERVAKNPKTVKSALTALENMKKDIERERGKKISTDAYGIIKNNIESLLQDLKK